MKLCVFFLFLAMPFLPWIGDWALRWTEGNEALQIVFTMFLFPLAMNALQYWIIDSFIMDKKNAADTEQKYSRVDDDEEDGGVDERSRLTHVDDEDDEQVMGKDSGVVQTEIAYDAPLKEMNPTPIPIEEDEDEGKAGSSRRSSPR